jgi:hypothetical protein
MTPARQKAGVFILLWLRIGLREGIYRPDPIKNITITTRKEIKKNSRIFPVFSRAKRVRMQ